MVTDHEMRMEALRLFEENERLRDFVKWVDSLVSNPVGAYSVSALDGLFGMTRDKIAALTPAQRPDFEKTGEGQS